MHLHKRQPPIGASPGTLVIPAASPRPVITLFDYGPADVVERKVTDPSELPPYLDTGTVTWVDVEGLGDEQLIRKIGEVFSLHPLALEDAVNLPQRPKFEVYDNFVLIITRLARMESKAVDADARSIEADSEAVQVESEAVDVETEQVAIFLGAHFVLTLQERCADIFDPVRARIRSGNGPIRRSGPDYLMYALLDTVVDAFYPVLEQMGEYLDDIEREILNNPQPINLRAIYNARRQLLDVRRAIWPQRDAVNAMIRDQNDMISADIRVYLRDIYDHTVQAIDVTETYRELATNLMDIYLSAIGQRTNEVMKVLTVVSSIFIPLTFIAGVYGMNFRYMPELTARWGYPICLAAMLIVAVGELIYFRRKGWLGGKSMAAVIDRPTDRH